VGESDRLGADEKLISVTDGIDASDLGDEPTERGIIGAPFLSGICGCVVSRVGVVVGLLDRVHA